MFSSTSYVQAKNNITFDTVVTHETCRLASKSEKIGNTSFDENFDVPIDIDVNTGSIFNIGQAVSSTIEGTSDQLKHHTFETLMERVSLT